MTDPLPDEALDRVFRTGRTANRYVDRAVPEDALRALYDLMKWGPTSTNQQPLRIVWCVSDEAKAKLAKHTYPGNAEKVLEAPVAAVLGMDNDFVRYLPRVFPHTDARGWYGDNRALIESSAFRNSSLQVGYLIVAARMLGLDTNPMSGFDEDAVNAAFFGGTAIRANCITTLGYADHDATYPRAPRLAFDEANRLE